MQVTLNVSIYSTAPSHMETNLPKQKPLLSGTLSINFHSFYKYHFVPNDLYYLATALRNCTLTSTLKHLSRREKPHSPHIDNWSKIAYLRQMVIYF